MRKALGVLCMLIGAAMLAASGWMLWENRLEEAAAGQNADQALVALLDAAPTPGAPDPEASPAPTESAEVPEMPTMLIDGQAYIGYLELPTIGLTLPVMSDWSYPQLRIAPCRYWGSVYDDSMVILAHNYERHFGRISALQTGDPVQFIDADGNIWRYVVAAQETLERGDVEKMIDPAWDLTLFTCTYGGVSRVTVRLNRVLAY